MEKKPQMTLNLIDPIKITSVEGNQVKYLSTIKECVDRLCGIGDYIHHTIADSETAELLDQIGNRILEIEKQNNPGKIVEDRIYSALDLLALYYDVEDDSLEDISLKEFEEQFPDIWTYSLMDMDECLRNNNQAVIVRFFDQSKPDGFEYRVAEVPDTIKL